MALRSREWRPRFQRREVVLDEALRLVRIEVAGHGEHAIVRYVETAEESVNVLERSVLQMLHAPDDVPGVGMPFGKEVLEDDLDRRSVGYVVHALATLVLDDVPLVIEVLLVDGVEEVAHAVRFGPEHQLERSGRHRLEVVCAVEVRRAIDPTLRDIRSRTLHQGHVLAPSRSGSPRTSCARKGGRIPSCQRLRSSSPRDTKGSRERRAACGPRGE